MTNAHPDVNDEDIGMRAFQLRKAKAVERAVERIRHALEHKWDHLTPHEIEELEWTLGELWAYIARDQWDDMRFGHLTLEDVKEILTHGRAVRSHTGNTVGELEAVHAIIDSKA